MTKAFTELVTVTSDSRHEIYICHMCSSRVGSPDARGHMYLNVINRGYRCVRCGGKGYSDKVPSERRVTLKNNNNQVIQTLSEIDAVPIVRLSNEYDYLCYRGFSAKTISLYDLRMSKYRSYRNRIIVPMMDNGYKGFQCRLIFHPTLRWINCRGFKRKNCLYNYERAETYDTIIITEGVFSAIAAGINAVATLGKEMSKEQFTRLVQLDKPLIMAMDGGEYKTEMKIVNALYSVGTDISVVTLPIGKDPADVKDFKMFLRRKERVDSSWFAKRKLLMARQLLYNK